MLRKSHITFALAPIMKFPTRDNAMFSLFSLNKWFSNDVFFYFIYLFIFLTG